MEDYAAQIRQAGAERVRMVATSASRDAENADEFTAGVVQRLGTPPEVISGDEEARLSFAGAVSVLEVPGRVAVVDIGEDPPSSSSGTTRWRPPSAGRRLCPNDRTPPAVRSPTAAEIAAATADIDAAIMHALTATAFDSVDRIVGLAGSVTTVAALAMGLPEYDSRLIHGSRISSGQVHEVTLRMLAATRAERPLNPSCIRAGWMSSGRRWS